MATVGRAHRESTRAALRGLSSACPAVVIRQLTGWKGTLPSTGWFVGRNGDAPCYAASGGGGQRDRAHGAGGKRSGGPGRAGGPHPASQRDRLAGRLRSASHPTGAFT